MKILFIFIPLIFLGYSYSVILLPEKIQKFSLVLSPFIGAIFIIIIGLALSVAKIGMNQELLPDIGVIGLKGYQLIIFFTFLTWIYAFIFHKKIALRFYRQSLFIIPLVLVIVLTGIFNFPDQSSLLSLSTGLQKTSIIDMVYHSGPSLSNVHFQLGTPILYSFYLSVFHRIPKNELFQTIGLSYLITFGIFILVIYLIKNINPRLKLFEYNGAIILTSAAIFSLSTLNVTVLFITLVVVAVYFLFQSYLHRTLQYIFTLLKIVLLAVLINPFFTGLLIKIYLLS